jgi:hypothetical protein
MLLIAIFPKVVFRIAGCLGIQTGANAVFLLIEMFSLLIILTLTVIISHMNRRIYRLTQILGIIEKQIRELNK